LLIETEYGKINFYEIKLFYLRVLIFKFIT